MGNTINYDKLDSFIEERTINKNISIGITKNGEAIRFTNNGVSQYYLLIKKIYIYPTKLEFYFEENILVIIERLNIVTNNMYELKYTIIDNITISGIMPEYKKLSKLACSFNLISNLAKKV